MYDELKKLAEAAMIVHPEFADNAKAASAYDEALGPEAVLALISDRDQLFGITEQLKAENELLRKDADRYRWLKSQAELQSYGGSDYCLPIIHAWDYKPGPELNEQFENLDTAIDAAMAEGSIQ